ncbi:hypothetical protein AKJ65_00025 [candidate division MSBL1 archaeon SCGC-AAA259E19]|uniref:HTH cro/C1-type domain-containing protein n=2 Tax=candidate division MSBL1 TaxID=215777 RepID=A0A133V506_9EURY|nr:hypothetical protein AKJ65_00025 [candidate division MSBL1 archaeon SCGC-AAA259E19]KXB01530.1 hypothetical protein AKJ41_01190 [candidate division MSBL1 archaeon SCGC-AAA259O05]
MRPPCEIVATKVLPAIRTVLVKDLINRHELSQKEVAESLGVTQAAVSQYLSSTRGDRDLEDKLKNSKLFGRIRELSDKIAEGNPQKSQISEDFCDICRLIRKEGFFPNFVPKMRRL